MFIDLKLKLKQKIGNNYYYIVEFIINNKYFLIMQNSYIVKISSYR